MKTLSIVRKMQLMMAASLVALIMVAGAGYLGVSTIGSALSVTQKNTMPAVTTIGDIQTKYAQYRMAITEHIGTGNADDMAKILTNINDRKKHLETQFDTYGKSLASDAKDNELLATDKKLFAEYQEVAAKVVDLSTNFGKDEADIIIKNTGAKIGDQLTAALAAHLEYKLAEARALEASSSTSARVSQLSAAGISIVGFVVVLLIGLFTIRGIVGALRNMSATMARLEDLDFTVRADASRSDELGQMAGVLNSLLDKLQANLRSIAQQAADVAAASSQMASNAEGLATTSEQQHTTASDIAATVEEMTVSINHVGDRAGEANRISSASGSLASSGEVVIGHTVSDIQNIAETVHNASALIQGLGEHSQEISSIVAVIKEVADQTNLLALNAAIEAARAGEQGRGFAVVADEVRKLAERTASSTTKISTTVDSMRTSAGDAVLTMQGVVATVEQGVSRAQEANAAIREIGEGSRNAVVMVEEITAAIREQGSATNSIANQVDRMAHMAEESSAAAGLSAEAAKQLDQLAADMQRIVSRYKL